MKDHFHNPTCKRQDFVHLITYFCTASSLMFPYSYYEYMIQCSYNIPDGQSSIAAAREFIMHIGMPTRTDTQIRWDNLPAWLSKEEVEDVAKIQTHHDYSHLDKVKDWPPAISPELHAAMRKENEQQT